MRTKTRRKRKTTGSRSPLFRFSAGLFLLLVLLAAASLTASAGDKKDKGKDSYALVAGTVFRDPGFALPGARVTLTPDPEPGQSTKIKKQKAVADARGEFVFRVPTAPMRYKVTAEADGLKTQEKPAQIQAAERVELFFSLEPVSH